MNIQPQPSSIPHLKIVGQTAFTDTSYVPLEPRGVVLDSQKFEAHHRFETLNRYRKYVQEYKSMIPGKNKIVLEYNAKVYAFIEQHKLTQQHQCLKKDFDKLMYMTSIEEYNQAARLKNDSLGKLLLPLKKHIKISQAAEDVFEQILFEYTRQIENDNAIYNEIDNPPRDLRRVKVNLYKIANNHDENGVFYCNYSPRTIQNHVKRFIEAGVLFGYQFKGYHFNKIKSKRSGKPSEYFINSAILVIYDWKNKQILNTDNQLYKYRQTKSLTNNKTVTRTYINKKEIIVPVNKQSQIKEIESPSSILSKMQLSSKNDNNENNNENTNLRINFETKENTRAAENFPKISEYLLNSLQDLQCFTQDLTNGRYNNYHFIHRHQLEKELYQGSLPKAEFRELLLQVFVKMSAPIWKDKTPTMPTWRKAWNMLNEDVLLNPNGSIPNKATLMYMFDNLVYRITFAKRYFNKFPEFNPLYPSQYFDPTRKITKSGGFAYTIEVLKKHQKHQENRHNRKEKQNIEAKKRNYSLKAIELVEKQVNKLKNNKITILELHDYVRNNAHIPQEIKLKLPRYIERAYKC